MKLSNTELKISIEKTEEGIKILEKYGYEKRSGGADYPQNHDTIVIVPSKKWYWTDSLCVKGLSDHIK